MAMSVLGRPPTCLGCLRRLAIDGSAKSRTAPSLAVVQTRSKTFRPGIQHDQGAVVRLLQDIPKFGCKHAIIRTERGRMRNRWYPRKMAEYMTAQRFRELGLTRDDIGERDPVFEPSQRADEVAAGAGNEVVGDAAEGVFGENTAGEGSASSEGEHDEFSLGQSTDYEARESEAYEGVEHERNESEEYEANESEANEGAKHELNESGESEAKESDANEGQANEGEANESAEHEPLESEPEVVDAQTSVTDAQTSITPEEALMVLEVLVPATLTFPAKLLRPCIDASTEAAEGEARTDVESGPLAIQGSVSAGDVVDEIKRLLSVRMDASRVKLEPWNVLFFVGPDGAGVDSVEKVGRWEVLIAVDNNEGKTMEPVRRVVRVVPEEEFRQEGLEEELRDGQLV